MATTNQRLTELEKDVAALETWRGQQLIHNRKQEEVDAALAARIAKLEGPVVEPPPVEPPPVEPPPVTPPQNGIVVMAGGGLKAAVDAAPAGSTLILRGGDHVLGSWGSGTTPGLNIRKKLSFWAYQGEKPRIHAGGSRPNLVYSLSGGVVDMHGIELATITNASYDDSNGSALCEAQGGGSLALYDCWLTFAPNSVTERQHQFYIADNPKLAHAERCHFDGGKNKGTGFHCYHAPGGPSKVIDCDFKNYGFDSTNGIAIIVDQSGADVDILHNTFKDCAYAAIQHRASARCYVKDNVGTNTTRGLQKSSTTNLTDINNVWN